MNETYWWEPEYRAFEAWVRLAEAKALKRRPPVCKPALPKARPQPKARAPWRW